MDLNELCGLFKVDVKDVKSSNKIDQNDKEKKIKFSVKDVLEFGLIINAKKEEETESKKVDNKEFLDWCKGKGWNIIED